MNVLVYSGPEVQQASLQQTISTIRSIVLPNYTVQTISKQALASHPWTTSCAALVLPGCNQLFASNAASDRISSYVENGGSFIALSCGTRLSSSALGNGQQERPISFFDRQSGSSLYLAHQQQSPPQVVSAQLADGTIMKSVYQHGASQISPMDGKIFVELARYHLNDGSLGDVAAAVYAIGGGKVTVVAPGVEYNPSEEPASTLVPGPGPESHQQTRQFVRKILALSGLDLPEEPPLNLHPLPQFLVSASPSLTTTLTESIDIKPTSSSNPQVLQDENDTFHFHPYSDDLELLSQEKLNTLTWDPKHVVICPGGEIPDSRHTPLFDLRRFYTTLSSYDHKPTTTPWTIGDALFYSQMVTSTQTMLDKNPKLLSGLPTPIVSVASHQLTGRGRGANVWLSPSGCLQYSILLRLPLSSFPAAKLVFIQYLAGLSILEACRDPRVLGPELGEKIRLKWPNDVYIKHANGELKKIGGILVNTSFAGGKVDIVVGCGVNVLNPKPIASLSQLVDENRKLSMEDTLAAILSNFQQMWDTFVQEKGSFEPFMDLYLLRWLHSDQLVTLETVTPPMDVRIAGITSDYGLLRTYPAKGRSPQPIDLQPDGNSFDLMAGLIRTKA